MRKRKGWCREDLQKRKDLSLEWKSEWVKVRNETEFISNWSANLARAGRLAATAVASSRYRLSDGLGQVESDLGGRLQRWTMRQGADHVVSLDVAVPSRRAVQPLHRPSRPRSNSFYRAMLCIRGTSHGPVSVSVSVRVCHKSVFYRNGWTNRAGFGMWASSTRPTLC